MEDRCRIGKTTEDRVLAFIPVTSTASHAGAAGRRRGRSGRQRVRAEGPISRQAAGGGLTKYKVAGDELSTPGARWLAIVFVLVPLIGRSSRSLYCARPDADA
jgi:hypothetical protein